MLDWDESDNILKSEKLENIISMEFVGKGREDRFYSGNMLDEWRET